MDNNKTFIYRQIIVSHYKNPLNYLLLNTNQEILNNYVSLYYNSDFCIDEITAYLKFNQQKTKIVDAKFSGTACAICTASTDICAEKLKNLSLQDGKELINNYLKMISQEDHDNQHFGELIAFEKIPLQPSRVNCAVLGPKLFYKLIDNQLVKNVRQQKTKSKK